MTVSHEALVASLRVLVESETPSGDLALLRRGFELLARLVEEYAGRRPDLGSVDGVPYLHLAPLASPSVLVVGHLDTVWPAGTLSRMPFVVEGRTARGPGVFDMKAGLVVALGALATSAASRHIGLLVTGDEEVGSATGRGLVERYAADASAVIVPEPSAPGGGLKTARKGVAMYRFALHGREAHAGLEPERGANATVELSALVGDLLALRDDARGTTVTPTVASSGTSVNTVPAEASLHVDVRAWTTAELNRVDAAVRARRPRVTGVHVDVAGGVNRPPLEAGVSASLVRMALAAATEVGLGSMQGIAVGGASDGNFTAALGVPTLDGAGAVGGGAHARDEHIDVTCLAPRTRWISRTVERWLAVATAEDDVRTPD